MILMYGEYVRNNAGYSYKREIIYVREKFDYFKGKLY